MTQIAYIALSWHCSVSPRGLATASRSHRSHAVDGVWAVTHRRLLGQQLLDHLFERLGIRFP
jgi:hypothetical protein